MHETFREYWCDFIFDPITLAASPHLNRWRTFVIRALLHPVGLATDALRDLADRAAAATIRTRERIAQLANAGAFGA